MDADCDARWNSCAKGMEIRSCIAAARVLFPKKRPTTAATRSKPGQLSRMCWTWPTLEGLEAAETQSEQIRIDPCRSSLPIRHPFAMIPAISCRQTASACKQQPMDLRTTVPSNRTLHIPAGHQPPPNRLYSLCRRDWHGLRTPKTAG